MLYCTSPSSGRVADKLFRAGYKEDAQSVSFMNQSEVQDAGQLAFSSRMIASDYRILDWVMDLSPQLETDFKDVLNELEEESNVLNVTSMERSVKLEGILEARADNGLRVRLKLLQELLKLPASSDEELEAMTLEQLQSLYSERGERSDSRRRLSGMGSQTIDSGSGEAHFVEGGSELT